MGVSRKCKKCGQQISIRQMPNGYWIPFDYNTNVQHKCRLSVKDKKTAPSEKINNTFPELPKETILEVINYAIENKSVLKIEGYLSISKDRWTIRRIVPHKLCEKDNQLFVDCYSYYAHDYRDYSIDRIKYAEVVTDKLYVPPQPDRASIPRQTVQAYIAAQTDNSNTNITDFEKPQTQDQNNSSDTGYLILAIIVGLLIYLITKM